MQKAILNALPSGTRLHSGKYTIQHALAQGAFGITYIAKTKLSLAGSLGSMDVEANVAIKEFFMLSCNGREGTSVTCSSSDGLNADYMQKFRHEAEHLSHLKHPGIVKVLELFEENGTCYYAMEYIDGGSLDDYISRRGHLPESEALALTKQIGEALSYMHRQHVLHLDLKPGNIMRHADGRLALIDFGLTKQYKDDGSPETSTTIGLGTEGYAPMEQAGYRKKKAFAPTLDIYALGATLFKMLTGHKPAKAADIFNDGFPAEELTSLGISPATIALVRKAMEPRRSDRFQTVNELLQALSRISGASDAIDAEVVEEATTVDKPTSKPQIPVPPASGQNKPKSKPAESKPQEPSTPIRQHKRFTTIMNVLAWVLIALLGVSGCKDFMDLYPYVRNVPHLIVWLVLYVSIIVYHIKGTRAWNFRVDTLLSMTLWICPSPVEADRKSVGGLLLWGLILLLLLEQLPGMTERPWREVLNSLRSQNLKTEWKAVPRNWCASILLILVVGIAVAVLVRAYFHEICDSALVALWAAAAITLFCLYAILFHRKWGVHLLTTLLSTIAVVPFICVCMTANLEYAYEVQRSILSIIAIGILYGLVSLPKKKRRYLKTMIAGHRDPFSQALLLLMNFCLLAFVGIEVIAMGIAISSEKAIVSRESVSSFYTINGHAYVDLGLSVKWATCNVGASSPEQYGNYYAWGETSTKSIYGYANSKTYEKSSYNFDIGGNSSLDAARANWGGTWRLPTADERQELLDECTWTRTTLGGKNGYRVTGPSGKSIFLPAAGYRDGSSLNYAGEDGYYWTSAPDEGDADCARGLHFYSSGRLVDWSRRNCGFSVRPVSE